MDTFEAITLGRYFWPRLFAVLLFVGLVFFQKPTYGLIEAEAKHRAREYTALLMEAVFQMPSRRATSVPQDVGAT